MMNLAYKTKEVLKFSAAFIASKCLLFDSENRNIWIITERRNECKDNGYYLFKYLREFHPEMKVYYVIENNAEHRKRIEKYGNIIDYNSWRHYVYSLAATRLIGAFLPCGIPDSFCFYKFDRFIHGKKVFLQHGITQSKVKSLFYDQNKVDCFICGAEPEYKSILTDFNYPYENVKYTGFCRFDGLYDYQKEKTILVMPTWRKWIPSDTWRKGYRANPDDFEFFRNFKALIEDPDIRIMLKTHSAKMIFFLHHEIQKYMDYYGASDDLIIRGSETEYDVQSLLKSCTCLITDYSSVAFDFAYMKKPVIYYQFDEREYYSKHYQKGYFEYDTMGFGNKCETLNDVKKELLHYFENDFVMDDRFISRVENFFTLHDRQNCARVYEVICEL